MSTAPKQRYVPGHGRGATALDPAGSGRPHRHHPRHLLGDTLRAARVFAEATFSVVILGQPEGRPTLDPHRV